MGSYRSGPRELVGGERGQMWNDVVLAQAPEVAKYARRAGRKIPVAVLELVGGRSSAQAGLARRAAAPTRKQRSLMAPLCCGCCQVRVLGRPNGGGYRGHAVTVRSRRARVASRVRVREVTDPKCRCPGVGRPRWIQESPRGVLPGCPPGLSLVLARPHWREPTIAGSW